MPLNTFVFANNVRTHLATPLTESSTTFTVTAGEGSRFPIPASYGSVTNSYNVDEIVAVTIVDDLGNMEIVYVTKRDGDDFTVLRAQEGTTAKVFEVGAIVELRITAKSLNNITTSLYVAPEYLGSPERGTGVSLPLPIMGSARVSNGVTSYRWVTVKNLTAGWNTLTCKSFISADEFNGAAKSLINSRSIDGINFNGTTSVVHLVVCDTAADVAAKVASVPNIANTADGSILYVKFNNGNTADVTTLTLDVGFGASPMKWRTGYVNNTWIENRESILPLMYYDNTWWVVGFPNTHTVLQTPVNDGVSYPILTTSIGALAVTSRTSVKFAPAVTVTPNSGTITASTFKGNLSGKLTTARSIDGVNFDGSSQVVHVGHCSTAADVAAKEVTIPGFSGNIDGAIVYIAFTNKNTAPVADLTLNVSNAGACPIRFKSSTGPIDNLWLDVGVYVPFINYGDTWFILGWPNQRTVLQYAKTSDNAEFPILTSSLSGISTSTFSSSNFVPTITINPATKTITASTFKGTATNAANANTWGGSNKYISTAGPSGGVNGDIWFQYL